MNVIGLGNDLLRVSRIARMGARDGDLLLHRMLTPSERLLAQPPAKAGDWRRVAAMIAGKEAFFKALGSGLIRPFRWLDIAIGGPYEAPTLHLTGSTARAFATLGGVSGRLTFSGDEVFILSTVILLGCEKARPRGVFPNGLPTGSEDSRPFTQTPVPGVVTLGSASCPASEIRTPSCEFRRQAGH
jgi:holo-[acyl-carrier protein] synthase